MYYIQQETDVYKRQHTHLLNHLYMLLQYFEGIFDTKNVTLNFVYLLSKYVNTEHQFWESTIQKPVESSVSFISGLVFL